MFCLRKSIAFGGRQSDFCRLKLWYARRSVHLNNVNFPSLVQKQVGTPLLRTNHFRNCGSLFSVGATRNYAKKPGKIQEPTRPVVFRTESLGKSLDEGKYLFQNISITLLQGAKIGVIGVNGAGKSSFLKIIAGLDTDVEGDVEVMPGVTVGYLPQEPVLDPTKTVRENIEEGIADKVAILEQYEKLSQELQDNGAKLSFEEKARLESKIKALKETITDSGLKHLPGKVNRAMNALRCPPADTPVFNLSGGERRRVALCRLLITQPDILCLDEPTNHLDAESVAWLERHLKEYTGTVLLVTHDRYFLDNITQWILEIDRGQFFHYKGNYSYWLEEKTKRIELEQRKEIAKIKIIKQELEWIRSSPVARQAKNKARISNFEKLSNQEKYRPYEPGTIMIPPAPRLGKKVIEIEGLTKTVGNKVLFRNLSFQVEPGAIVGVVGPNGSGKTTLFKILTNAETPDEGTVRFGESVRLGLMDQVRSELNPEKSVLELVSEGDSEIDMGDYSIDVRQFIAGFNFKGSQQDQLIRFLSGGERNRVQLAKMIKQAPNVILLDEPTNDLDVDVLRNLEYSLDSFSGSAIVVSHDRYFLDRICTHILAFEGGGNVTFFRGNYTDYVRIRGGPKLGEPSRVKYHTIHGI